jgi:hypothetical protein
MRNDTTDADIQADRPSTKREEHRGRPAVATDFTAAEEVPHLSAWIRPRTTRDVVVDQRSFAGEKALRCQSPGGKGRIVTNPAPMSWAAVLPLYLRTTLTLHFACGRVTTGSG